MKRIWLRRAVLGILIFGLCCMGFVLGVSGYVKHQAAGYLLTPEAAAALEDVDCILILGCGVRADGSPSLMLRDRLDMGHRLYEAGVAPKLLMSGDHSRTDYDEVNTMKDYAMAAGVPSEDVFMDHAGFSTYESMYRARDIFCAEKIVIVSQEYHLSRAVYDARALGLDAYGMAAEDIRYAGQFMRDLREILARCKDFFYCLLQPEPTFLGEAIPVSGNGDWSNG
ncbi:MAG: vancomycin high temperature exclusion protein [Candidatus Avoscillospira sp.]